MKLSKRVIRAVCVLFVALGVAGASCATTWDLSTDWSGTGNPSGAWSYGQSATVGGAFTPYASVGSNTWGNVYAVGRIMKTTGTGIVSLWNAQNPDYVDRQAVARWTSPVSGTVHVWSRFSYEDTSNRRGIVYVYHNSAQKYAKTVMNWDFPFCWDGNLSVSVGDTVDFVVGADPVSPYPTSYAAYDTWATITTDPVGTVSGAVTADVTGGQPVPYAIIRTSDGRYAATCGSDGSYSLTLPAGVYALTASSGYFTTQQISGVAVSGGGNTRVDFLLAGVTISGSVTSDASGSPVAGATVRLLGEGASSTATDSIGQYTLKVQPCQYSRYNLLASAAGFDPMKCAVTTVTGTPLTRSFALRPSDAGLQLSLPAPTQWGEPPSAPVPPGDTFPVSFADTGTLPGPDAPVIAGWNETVKPDESFTLTGARFTTRTGADAGTDTTVWVWARTSASAGVLRQAKVWKVTGETILATMPDDVPFGTYLLWVESSAGVSSPVLINRVRTTYVGPLGNITYPGATIRVMGKNMSHNRGSAQANAYVYVQPASGGAFTACTVTRVDPYMVEFTLPGGLSYGNYNVFVHNGHGGIYGWSDPLDITVQAQWIRGSNQVNLSPNGFNDTGNIQNAINTVTSYANGGTINLSAGTFIVTGAIQLKDNVEIKGAGMDATFINLQMASNVSVFELMGAHAGMSDLTIREMPGYSSYGAVITHNWTLIASYTTFKRIKFTGPSGTNPIWIGRLAEMSDCIVYAQVGSFSECWIYQCTFYGARYNTSEAPFIAGYKRDIYEFNRTETQNWPYDPTKPDPYNYKNNLAPEVWGNMCWAWRIALTYCDDLYAAHNTSKDVATQQNRGEMWLFHGYPALWFGSVASSNGLTLSLRTDGLVGGQVVTIKNYDSQWLTGGAPVPDGSYYGNLDPLGGSDEIHADQSSYKITIVSGTGMGQYRKITSHTPSSVTVDRPWLVRPDSTSIAIISKLRVDNTLYKNEMNAFPAGYNRVTGAQSAYGADGSIGIAGGNLWALSAEGNISHRTTTGWSYGVGQAIPLCWNEQRDDKAYDCAGMGYYVITFMGEQGPGPGPLCGVGNVWHGGEAVVIGGAANSTSATGVYLENTVSTAIDNVALTSKRGIHLGGINGPAPYGTTLSTSPYGSMLFRKCNVLVYNNPSVQPGVPQPVFFSSYNDGQMLSGNTYSGSAQTYFGVGSYQSPVALNKCARFKGYVGGHVDPAVVSIANAGLQTMNWTVTPSDSWITATIGASPTVSAEGEAGRVIVSVNTTAMAPGQHWGYLTVSTGVKSVKVGVCVDILAGSPTQQSPIASFTATPLGGITPVNATFDAGASTDPDGSIASYTWDFGDGTGATGVTAGHTYATPGVYLVTLTVTDNSGNTSIAASTITAGSALTGVSISGSPNPPVGPGTNVTLTATPTGGYNVSYKFLLRAGTTWTTLRDYSSAPTIDWSPPSVGYYAIRVLARSAVSVNAYDAMGEIAYPVGLVPPSGLKLWLRGDSGVGLDDNGKVSSWADQSGAGNNTSQGTDTNRPSLIPNAFDGKPAVRFTGPSQTLQTTGLVLTNTTPFTAFTAAKFNSVPSSTYQYLWWNGTSSTTAGYGCYISTMIRLRSGWGSQSFYLGQPSTETAVPGVWYKMCSRYTPGNHQAWLDGVYLNSNAKNDSNFSSGGIFSVGTGAPDSTKGFYGDIGEILIYDRALSDAERADVETYFAAKWSPVTALTRDRLLDVKSLSDQTVVSITNPKVATVESGVFTGGVYYVEEPDRTCGLKIIGGPSVSRWENVTITGTVGTDSNGERVLQASSIDTRTAGIDLGKLGMINKSCASSGQLVRVWGKVTGVGAGYFTLDDGSGSPMRVDTSALVSPITVNIQTGYYLAATGLAGKGTGGITVVRPRSDSDIQVY